VEVLEVPAATAVPVELVVKEVAEGEVALVVRAEVATWLVEEQVEPQALAAVVLVVTWVD
jgi:hypothetical protein